MDLVEIERIKQLKARYFRFIDTKQWDRWGMVFTEDAELHHPANRTTPLVGRQAIVETVSRNLQNAITVHHGHMPEINLLGPREAQGVWAMYDRLSWPVAGGTGHAYVEGYGHYIERYRKEADDEWRIARLELRRLSLERRDMLRDADAGAFPA